jgi:hypothetical protein
MSHCFVHFHELKGNAAVTVNHLNIQHTQRKQLTAKDCKTVRKLSNIGPAG